MMPPGKPVLGIMPRALWRDINPHPSRAELAARAGALREAIARYRLARLEPLPPWVDELGELDRELAPRWKRVALVALGVVLGVLFVGWSMAGLVAEFVGAYRARGTVQP